MLQAKTPRVTIQDVAAFSICTVSPALQNLPNVSVQSRTKGGDAAGNLGRAATDGAQEHPPPALTGAEPRGLSPAA